MFWVIQHNLWKEEGFTSLMNALDRFGCASEVVKVVPFSNRLIPVDYDQDIEHLEDIPEPTIPTEGLVVVCGSVTLARIAKTRGWIPGSFLTENFDYTKWRENYGAHLLNFESEVCRFDEVSFPSSKSLFVRPCKDTKAFCGQVFEKGEFEKWRNAVLDLSTGHTTLRANTQVAVAPLKHICREFRFFVVDKVLVTQSQYKLGTRVVMDPAVEPDIISFAQEMVDIWQPSRAFVLDIALTDEGFKIVEINNLNSAGFYSCDVTKIVAAVESMSFD